MTKTPVKFRKNQYKTAEELRPQCTYFHRGMEGQRGGRMEGQNDGKMGGQKDGEPKTKSFHFSSKKQGKIQPGPLPPDDFFLGPPM